MTAYRKLVVGFDGSEQSKDALALGRLLAQTTGAELTAACVYGSLGAVAHPDLGRWQAELREAAERTLAEGAEGLEQRAVESASPGRGLHDLAETEHADLLIVGSSHRGPAGRVVAGSVAERLLHGAPCALAVAPLGFATRNHRLAAIAVGYDGTGEAELALGGAVELARAAEARVRIVGIARPTESAFEAGFETLPGLPEAREQQMESIVQAALDSVSEDLEATGEVIAGGTAELGEQPGVDLLVVGSRGYGSVRRVLLGSTAAALIHHANYPVIVFPRGAEAPDP